MKNKYTQRWKIFVVFPWVFFYVINRSRQNKWRYFGGLENATNAVVFFFLKRLSYDSGSRIVICMVRLNQVIMVFVDNTVEPRSNEGPRDWQYMFAITRFCYIEVLFHIFYQYWGKENCSLYRGSTVADLEHCKTYPSDFEHPGFLVLLIHLILI